VLICFGLIWHQANRLSFGARVLLHLCAPTGAGGRREAAGGHSLPKSAKTKNHATDNDCTNERPDNNLGPSAASSQIVNDVASNAAEHSAD
jgi:hypothetical protein